MTRRQLLASAAASVAVPDPGHSILAYVGTYTGRGGNGKGIHLFRLNLKTGALAQIKVVSEIPSPGWLAIHPNRKYLYAANEISRFSGARTGSVTALAIDRSTGDLTQLNVVSSQGAGPAHLSVDPLAVRVRRELRRWRHRRASHAAKRIARERNRCPHRHRVRWTKESHQRSSRQLCHQRTRSAARTYD